MNCVRAAAPVASPRPAPACAVPGLTPRGGDSPGHRLARGRPGVGTHPNSSVPRVHTHSESRGVPDSPPHRGFRDVYMMMSL